MKTLARRTVLGFVAAAMLAAGPATMAAVDVSFGGNFPVGDDGNLFFSISSRYFGRPMPVVDSWGSRFQNPDDLAVFLHICSQTRTSPEVVFSYRKQGMSWFNVGLRVGVPVDTWYVPVAVEPGPPYGKAYGYWRKHKKDPHYAVKLSDRQCRDLVAVRMAHDYYGVSPQVAMDWRRDGTKVNVIMTREYRTRHESPKSARHGHENGDDQGHSHSQGRGHDKHEKH